jgi:predicted GNAT superfamily acetyltransferase
MVNEGDVRREGGAGEVIVLATRETAGGFREPVGTTLQLDGRSLAAPIPDDIAAIRRADAGLGMAWRLFLRETFQTAFAAGYVIVDCVELPGVGWHYLLKR